MMEWISVKDEYPKINYSGKKFFIHVLATDGKKIWKCIFRHIVQIDGHGKQFFYPYFHTYCDQCGEGIDLKKITHWMLLPKLPKVKK